MEAKEVESGRGHSLRQAIAQELLLHGHHSGVVRQRIRRKPSWRHHRETRKEYNNNPCQLAGVISVPLAKGQTLYPFISISISVYLYEDDVLPPFLLKSFNIRWVRA